MYVIVCVYLYFYIAFGGTEVVVGVRSINVKCGIFYIVEFADYNYVSSLLVSCVVNQFEGHSIFDCDEYVLCICAKDVQNFFVE